LFFDTETTGVPRDYQASITDSSNWPRLVQLGWIVTDDHGRVLKKGNHIIKPEGFIIPSGAASVHGITTERALAEGESLRDVLDEFMADLDNAYMVVGHNVSFDQHIVGAELYRMGYGTCNRIITIQSTCTMEIGTDICKIGPFRFGSYKWPKLQELYRTLFGFEFDGAHDAMADITATKQCYFEMCRQGII